jgi:ADP-ribose pyrophosphatase
MSDHAQYLEFAQAHPQLFVNPPGPIITILLGEDAIQQVEAQMAAKLAAAELPRAWAQVGIVYQDQYLLVLRDAVRFADGSTGTYFRIIDPDESAPGVVMLPVYQGQVLLIHHFRHAPRGWFLELPRGYGVAGVPTEANLRRELWEELGATATRIVPLGQTHPDTGMIADRVELFYVEVASYSTPQAEEAIDRIQPVSVVEFERLLRDNEITCGFTLAAYARARLRGLI